MTLQSLSNSLESILRYDKSRLNTVGKLIQNSIIYIVLIFLFGTLIEDIFPNLEKSKPSYLIILEVLGQLILISFIIFYLQKIVDFIPYIGGEKYDSDDASLPYCEGFIILIILISTQTNLINKIKYIYELFNDSRIKKEETKVSPEDNDQSKINEILNEEHFPVDSNENKKPQLKEEHRTRDTNTINQRINIYNQDDRLKYVPKDKYSQPVKPLITSNDFLKDSMIMDYVNLVKDSNSKIDSKFPEHQKNIDSYNQLDNNFSTFNNPSLSDNKDSFGTSISKIPVFNQLSN